MIESDQGLNYIDQLEIKNSDLIHTDLAFEYVSNLDVEVNSVIDSVKNPISGKISAPEIRELIIDQEKVDPAETEINCAKINVKTNHSDLNQLPKD